MDRFYESEDQGPARNYGTVWVNVRCVDLQVEYMLDRWDELVIFTVRPDEDLAQARKPSKRLAAHILEHNSHTLMEDLYYN